MLRTISSLGLASLLLTTPCFSGIYVGIGAGPEGATFNQSTHVVGNSPMAPEGLFDVIATNNFSGVGGFGTVFAGYEWRYNQFYLAGEINGNLSSVQYNLKNEEYIHLNFAKTTFSMRNSLGISVLPGYLFPTNTLFYGRVGYSNGHLKIFEGADPSIQNFNQNLNGVRYGLGLRQELSPKWAIRMDYSQISYDPVTSFTLFPDAGVAKVAEITPTTAQVEFAVLYRFDNPVVYSK